LGGGVTTDYTDDTDLIHRKGAEDAENSNGMQIGMDYYRGAGFYSLSFTPQLLQ